MFLSRSPSSCRVVIFLMKLLLDLTLFALLVYLFVITEKPLAEGKTVANDYDSEKSIVVNHTGC